ncbi:MAG: SH3 domain-containing protein, partial [Clostridiales bacterium]|nr:SH3 domain-containing protein [Clostridiales bacterium]
DPKPDPKPDPGDSQQKQYGRVNVSTTLNVRKGPGTNNARVASLSKGTRVEILDRSGAWYKIKYGSIQGYVHGDYIVLEGKGGSSSPPPGQDQNSGKTDPAPPPSDDKRYGIVTASSLNVRSGPSTKNHKVGMVAKGKRLTILGTQGSWYRISFNGKDAYVHSNYVRLESTSTPPSSTVTGIATVTASSLNVRSGAGTGYKRIGSLPRNRQVELLGKQGSWYKIKFASGTGYVHGDYLKIGSSANNGSNNSGNQDKTQQRTGTVNASALNVRTGPGTGYARVGLLPRGAKVTITGESGSWYKIQSGSINGYVSKTYIK